MTPWHHLDTDQQLRLREDYNRDPDCLTGTCSLEAKTAHFTEWLAARGISFSERDLHPRREA
ncbi:MAG: hypothetical protein CL814_17605 [Confluentimicrobium sp.]|jgi:hypothetical protein|uniref:hypothetical protein n=1 Tax=Actibacterium sp. TaxID=1872125 RepID=UPI00050E2B2E|nr:hypothetical protein [Actibacterium sp.]KGB81901.1 hypothetical protein JT55_10705 [Rhodovulum sp. NI22]MBC58735.1 hypothetical protein [Actibacterium sp.]MDY6859293.1 hypothetical protein [Pseudomonadota bacterium]|tara:strand:- start:1493 stop:1678 length:186 start_codon:yes stop_codon:yes gene_type:complete